MAENQEKIELQKLTYIFTSRGCRSCVYCGRSFCVKSYDKVANNSSKILGVKIPITTLACYDAYDSCGTFDLLSFICRRKMKRFSRNLFPNLLDFLSVHNSFKAIAENERS